MCLFQRAIMSFVASELINFNLIPFFLPFFPVACPCVLSVQSFSRL